MFKPIRQTILVLFIALLIFLVIYFFYPSVSMKFFGIAHGEEEAVESAIMENDQISEEDKRFFSEYVDTDGGKELIDSLVHATRKGVGEVQRVLLSFKESAN